MPRRPERLAETLRAEIGEVVGFELDDPRLVAVTVTDVVVADDLRDAKVYVLIDGSEAEVAQTMKALQAATPFVRRQVAMNMSLKYVPLIHFARDTAEENAARVNELLSGLNTQGETNEKEEG
jgi:ribosome-binding factor A